MKFTKYCMFNVNTKLKDFQKRTVRWMIKQEKENNGGLLLNEPGTGKSICCLDLILKTTNITNAKKVKNVKETKKDKKVKETKNVKDVKNDNENVKKTEPQKTLVLCPSGLVMNRVNEIKKHTNLTDKNIYFF